MSRFRSTATGKQIALINGGRDSCVLPDTTVEMADGSKKQINRINPGDSVKSPKGSMVSVFATGETHIDDTLLELTTSNGKNIVATKFHPFLTSGDLVVCTDEIDVGSKILTSNGLEIISSVQRRKYRGPVYILTLSSQAILNEIENTDPVNFGDEQFNSRTVVWRKNPFLGLNHSEHGFFANGFASMDFIIQSFFAPLGPDDEPGLAKLLIDRDVEMRCLAIQEIANLYPFRETSVYQIAAALGDSESVVRQLAARELGKMGHHARMAAPSLMTMLNDDEESVRKSSEIALQRIEADE